MPWEFSVNAPCFSGLEFISQSLSRMKCRVIVRGFHFADAAIFARVAGFGKNVVPLWRLWNCGGFWGPELVQRLRVNRRLHVGGEFGHRLLHKFSGVDLLGTSCFLVQKQTASDGFAAETRAVVCFQPVERGVCFRIQPELGTVLNEGSATLWILHRAAGFGFIRPGLDFCRRFFRAIGQQPGADLLMIFRGLHGGFELAAGDAFETEEPVVQRTVVMIFAEPAPDAGPAFVNGPARDGESGEAFARTGAGLASSSLGQ